MWPKIKQILPLVEKPFRYIGGETGIPNKDWDKACVRICLGFPDIYELGMSNTGLPILYNIVNNQPEFLADRVYTPWPDMQDQLKQNNIPLFSLDHKKPISDFDVLGITLPYELSYTNVLSILELSDISFYAKDRDGTYPLVIGGGPCAFNPEPIAPFFDAILLGDGESAIIQILKFVQKTKNREKLLKQLAKIAGVYVPSLGKKQQISKAVIDNLEEAIYPEHPVVPYAAAHNRAGIEISRGCQRGCRFCQAGFVYRPVRHRAIKTVVDLAQGNLANTGQEDFSFLSLSVSDYPNLCELLGAMQEATKDQYVNPQFPSLRVESLSDSTLDIIKKARGGSFTLAPEAGTERMRRIINKGNTDEDLYNSVEKIFSLGWHRIKLYFMIGLPGETREDLEGIVKISKHCLQIGKKHNRRAEVTVSTSIFVPKAHTPFQWTSQISVDEAESEISYLQKHLRGRGLSYRWHNAQMSFLEGVLARGGQEIALAIAEVYKSAERFDGWDDFFTFDQWLAAFAKFKIDPEQYHKAQEQNAKFPWDHLYIDLKKKFLWQEYQKSLQQEVSSVCSLDNCLGCGVCNTASGVQRTAYGEKNKESEVRSQKSGTAELKSYKYRIKFKKTGAAAFLGHLELINVLNSGFRRAGLPLKYSEGFHPHPKLSFGKALGVGIESECEFCDLEILEDLSSEEILKKCAQVFPQGIVVDEVFKIDVKTSSIENSIQTIIFEISNLNIDKQDLAQAIKTFQTRDSYLYNLQRKKKANEINLKDYIADLALLENDGIRVQLIEQRPMVKIIEVIQAIFGLDGIDLKKVCIIKKEAM